MKNLLFLLLAFISIKVSAMSAPPICSAEGQKQRETGYRFLPGVTGTSTIFGTILAIRGVEERRDGKAFTTDAKMFLMGVSGLTIGIIASLAPDQRCVVREKGSRNHLPDLNQETALHYRKDQRKHILKNLAISTGYMALLSGLTKGESNRNAIYVLGGVPLIMAGVQTLFINDDDLAQGASVTLLKNNDRLVPGIAWYANF